MKKLILLILALASTAKAANQFCGNLGTVRAGYNGDDFISSVVLYDKNATDKASTAYNDKYLNIRNDDNSVADGYESVELLKRLFKKETGENLVDYAYESSKLRQLNFQVCLFDFQISTRHSGSRVEARANTAVAMQVALKGKQLYEGSIDQALIYLRGQDQKSYLIQKIQKLQQDLSDVEAQMQALDSSVVNQL